MTHLLFQLADLLSLFITFCILLFLQGRLFYVFGLFYVLMNFGIMNVYSIK